MQTVKTRSEILKEFVNKSNVQKALNKQQLRVQNDTLIFSIQKSIKYFGMVLIAGSLGMFLIQNIAISIILFLLLGAIGTPLLLIGLFAAIYLDNEKIVYRNPIGIRKTIYWKDVKSVYFTSFGNEMKICSDDVTILPNTFYKGAEYLDEIIRTLIPEAFDKDSILAIRKTKEFSNKDGIIVFRIRKWLAGIAIFFMLFFWVPMIAAFILDDSPLSISFIWLALLWNVPLILIIIYTFRTRLYFGNNEITLKNCFGRIKSFQWNEIEAVNRDNIDCIKLYSNNRRLKISGNFAGYGLIHKLISERCSKKSLSSREW